MGEHSRKGDFKKNDPRINKKGRPRGIKTSNGIRITSPAKLASEIRDILLLTKEEFDKSCRDKNETMEQLLIMKLIDRSIRYGAIDDVMKLLGLANNKKLDITDAGIKNQLKLAYNLKDQNTKIENKKNEIESIDSTPVKGK